VGRLPCLFARAPAPGATSTAAGRATGSAGPAVRQPEGHPRRRPPKAARRSGPRIAIAAIELWKHWDQVWNWITHHKAIAALVMILAPPVAALVGIVGALKYVWKHWDQIWGWITGKTQWAWDHISPVFDLFAGAFDGVSGALYGFWTYAGKAWDGISGLFKGGVNDLIGFVNFLIDFWDSVSFSFPGVKIPIPGVPDIPGFNISLPHIADIPKLAAGGTAATAGWSVVGDRGPELRYMPQGASVVPLGKLPGMSGPQATASSAGDGMGTGPVEVTVTLNMQGAYVTDPMQLFAGIKEHVTDAVHQGLLRRKARGADLMLT